MSSLMEQFGFPSAETAKAALFEQMKEVGASRLEASYSGGNDEGGVDEIKVLIDADGRTIPVPERWYDRPATAEDDDWEIRKGIVHVWNPLWEAADSVLSTEFGSWAGEYSAHGTLFADLKEGRVWRQGEMEVSTYEEDNQEY